MKGIVDRIEGEFVVIELNEEMINVHKSKLPEDIKEGDIVELVGEEFVKLPEETERRKSEINDLFNDLKKWNVKDSVNIGLSCYNINM